MRLPAAFDETGTPTVWGVVCATLVVVFGMPALMLLVAWWVWVGEKIGLAF